MDKNIWAIILFFLFIFVMWYSEGGGNHGEVLLEPRGKYFDTQNSNFFQKEEIKPSSQPAVSPSIAPRPSEPEIRIHASSARKTDPQEEYLTLRADYGNEKAVNITGWTLKNKKGREIKIGRGTYLPYSARVNYEEDILLAPGAKAIITTGKSPVGTSFRVNSCAGYFRQFQNFTPRLSSACPPPSRSPGLYAMEDSACIDYIRSLPRCEIPLSMPLNIKSDCREYISEHINYNGCVNDYRDRDDFYENEWRVYLGQKEEFWQEKYGEISVFNQNGELMGKITY